MGKILKLLLIFLLAFPPNTFAVPNPFKQNKKGEEAFIRGLLKLQNNIGVTVENGQEVYTSPDGPLKSMSIAADTGFDLARDIIFALTMQHPSFFSADLIHQVQTGSDGSTTLGPKDVSQIPKKTLQRIFDHFETHQELILRYLPSTHDFNKALSAVPSHFKSGGSINFASTIEVETYRKLKPREVPKKNREKGAAYYTPGETLKMGLLDYYLYVINPNEFKGTDETTLEGQAEFKKRFEYLIKHYLLFLNSFYFGGCYKIGMFLEQGYPAKEKETDKIKVKPVDHFTGQKKKDILKIIFNWYLKGKDSTHPQILGSLARMYFDKKDEQSASVYVKKAFESTYDNLEGRRWLMGILYLTHTEVIPDIEHVEEMPDSTKAAFSQLEGRLSGISTQQTQTHSRLNLIGTLGGLYAIYQTSAALGGTTAEIVNGILNFTDVETVTQDIIEITTTYSVPVGFGLTGALLIGCCGYCLKGQIVGLWNASKRGASTLKQYHQKKKKEKADSKVNDESDDAAERKERLELSQAMNVGSSELAIEHSDAPSASEESDESEEESESGGVSQKSKAVSKDPWYKRAYRALPSLPCARKSKAVAYDVESGEPPRDDLVNALYETEEELHQPELFGEEDASEESDDDEQDRTRLEAALKTLPKEDPLSEAEKENAERSEKERSALAKALESAVQAERKETKAVKKSDKEKRKKRHHKKKDIEKPTEEFLVDSAAIITVQSPKPGPGSPPAPTPVSKPTTSPLFEEPSSSLLASTSSHHSLKNSAEPEGRTLWGRVRTNLNIQEDKAAQKLRLAGKMREAAHLERLARLREETTVAPTTPELAPQIEAVLQDTQQEALLFQFARVMQGVKARATEQATEQERKNIMDEASAEARRQGISTPHNLADFAPLRRESLQTEEVAPGVRLIPTTIGVTATPRSPARDGRRPSILEASPSSRAAVTIDPLALKAIAAPTTEMQLTPDELTRLMRALNAQQTYECRHISKKTAQTRPQSKLAQGQSSKSTPKSTPKSQEQ